MAEKYGVSVPQLCIRYTLQLGAISLPKTGNLEHMKTNADVDFEISAEDMEVLHNGLVPDRKSHNSSYLPDRHSFFPPPGKQTKLIIQRVLQCLPLINNFSFTYETIPFPLPVESHKYLPLRRNASQNTLSELFL